MKRFLTLMIAVSMLASSSTVCLSASSVEVGTSQTAVEMSAADDSVQSGDFTYKLSGTKSAVIVSYTGDADTLEIPGELDGKTVVGINKEAFEKNNTLVSVTVPDGVTEIGGSAFKECKSLTDVKLPDSITAIGDRAFYGCKSLENINYPAKLTNTGFNILSGTGVKKIEIPEGVKETTYFCRAASSVEEIVLPSTIKTIAEHSFADCTDLAAVNIPDSVTKIGSSAFENCKSLTSVKLSDNIVTIEYRAFSGCKSLSEINFPKKLSTTGWYILSNTNVSKVEVPEGVKQLNTFFKD